MCQHSRDGGRRCPAHRHDSAAVIRAAVHASGLLPKQMDNLFSELRREGRSAAAPTETEWNAKLDALEAAVSDNEAIREKVISQISKARNHPSIPDGATAYTLNLLVERAKVRATNLNTKLREIARDSGMTLAQVRAKFMEEYNAVDRSRGSEAPPEYTQTARRRAVQAGIPYDRSTVVALARVAAYATAERGPRRVERLPAGSSLISEYGYDEDGGRLEIVFRINPETVFAYHNVPLSTWERTTSGSSAGSVYAREIRGNSYYMYDNAEDAENDAYQVRCTSCGQFRAPSHECPRRDVSNDLAEKGLTPAQINEIVGEVAPAFIDYINQESEENPTPTSADSVPSGAYEGEDVAPEVDQEGVPAEESKTPHRRGRTHRLLTVDLAGRKDVSVVDDGTNPAYISFGGSVSLTGPGSNRATRSSWHPYSAVSIPRGTISSYVTPTEEDIAAVNTLIPTYSQLRWVSAPPSPTDIRHALNRADVSIPIAAQFTRGSYGHSGPTGKVTGTMMLHREDDDSVSVSSHTLKCTCAEYAENYDCPHVRMAAGQPQVFLNIGSRRNDVDCGMSDFHSRHFAAFRRCEEAVTHYMRSHNVTREEAVAALAREREEAQREMVEHRAQQDERQSEEKEHVERENDSLIANLQTYRESMMKRWETQDEKYADNPERFYNEYKASLSRKRKGEKSIPFKLENVTDGVCADVPGARKFGVELEFDFKRGVDKEAALQKIGRELHAAGLTKYRSQQSYHAAGDEDDYSMWSLEEDDSVDAELVSPIMSDTPEHWAQLQKAIKIIKRNGGKATTRCGSHVHVSTASYGASTAKHAELLRTVNQNEDVLYRLASDPSRGKHRGTRWCAPNVCDNQNDISDDIQQGHKALGNLESRDTGLNFEGTSHTQLVKSNIEFRMWDGTLDPAVIQQQIKVSAAITDYAERSVIENKGSKKPTERPKRIGHGKDKESQALSSAGTKTHTAESFKETNGHVAEFLDKLFRRNEDKAGVASLFALTNWQPPF